MSNREISVEEFFCKLRDNGVFVICALPFEADNTENIFYSGLGKINAAIKSTEIIKSYNPKKIINYGSCGAINTELSGIIRVNKFFQHDIDCTPLGFERGITPYDDIQEIASDESQGYSCASGDYFVLDKNIISSDVVDMEAYAIAKTCKVFGVKFDCYKYISDNADNDAADNWKENCSKGFNLFVDCLHASGNS